MQEPEITIGTALNIYYSPHKNTFSFGAIRLLPNGSVDTTKLIIQESNTDILYELMNKASEIVLMINSNDNGNVTTIEDYSIVSDIEYIETENSLYKRFTIQSLTKTFAIHLTGVDEDIMTYLDELYEICISRNFDGILKTCYNVDLVTREVVMV
jgi:hypothetical protein